MARRGQREEISSKNIKKGQTLISTSYISLSTIMQRKSKTTLTPVNVFFLGKHPKSISMTLLFLSMVVGLSLAPAYGQSSNAAQTFSIPLAGFQVTDNCGVVSMLITDGYMHIVSRTVASEDGSLQSHTTINWVGVTGVEPFGTTQYRLTSAGSSSETIRPDGGATHTDAITYNFIVQGGPPATQVHGTIHFTADANGRLTVDHYDIRSDCT
jgi:hypothetical protein